MLLGQQPMTVAQAAAAGSLLEPGEDVTRALLQPSRGVLDSAVPADPTIYVRREPDPGGDRVIVTLDGKLLPYQR